MNRQKQQTNGITNGINGYGNDGPVDLDLDALVIGGGFGGVYLLHRLRREGFNVKLVEAGKGLGGIWHWNNCRYIQRLREFARANNVNLDLDPGARVDSGYPVYQLAIPEVYETWQWTEEYPGSQELQRYFQHIDNTLNISKDTIYNTRVGSATWNDSTHKWIVVCDDGTRIATRFLHCCLGFAAKRHFPDWPGLENYQGYVCHSSFWPVEGVDMKGKKMAVVGNGATGIQIAQTAAREAGELGVFIRTPNTAIPMNQQLVDPERAKKDMATLSYRLNTERYQNLAGFLLHGQDKPMKEDTPERREEVFDEAYAQGGFRLLFTYNDILTSAETNRAAYDYWAKRTRARISDPVKRDILAPLEPPHPFAGKRPSLEQDYYEQMDKDHVKLIDLKTTPVSHVEPKGIVTKDGTLHEFDIIAIATGFDSLTGGFMEIDFKGIDGEDLQEKWNTDRGALSYLGMTVNNFPNMFYTYGPHAPTAYSNGPSCVEPQADFITDTMKQMREQGQTKINATKEAEDQWKETVNYLHSLTLRHNVDSWYMGALSILIFLLNILCTLLIHLQARTSQVSPSRH